MKKQKANVNPAELNKEVRRIWDKNAEWWDDKIGDGNDYQCELLEPSTEYLLNVSKGDIILDIACGAGRFARRMAELGAYVVACDFSENFIKRAKKRTPKNIKNIEYHIVDATNEKELLSLGKNRFNKAVSTMALQDIANIDPLMKAVSQNLKPHGHFVFSLPHPCLNSVNISRFSEMDEGEKVEFRNGIKISHYITPCSWKGLGIIGQPEPHYYFHRPLEILFNTGFKNGFVIDGIKEPVFKKQPGAVKGKGINLDDMWEIPPVLVIRMRLEKK